MLLMDILSVTLKPNQLQTIVVAYNFYLFICNKIAVLQTKSFQRTISLYKLNPLKEYCRISEVNQLSTSFEFDHNSDPVDIVSMSFSASTSVLKYSYFGKSYFSNQYLHTHQHRSNQEQRPKTHKKVSNP